MTPQPGRVIIYRAMAVAVITVLACISLAGLLTALNPPLVFG